MTATPRPWRVEAGHPFYIRSADGEQVARCIGPSGPDRAPEIAALIVRAVNAHDELVAFVADVVEHLTRRGPIDELTWRDDQRFTDEHGDPLTFVDSARALLAQVKP